MYLYDYAEAYTAEGGAMGDVMLSEVKLEPTNAPLPTSWLQACLV